MFKTLPLCLIYKYDEHVNVLNEMILIPLFNNHLCLCVYLFPIHFILHSWGLVFPYCQHYSRVLSLVEGWGRDNSPREYFFVSFPSYYTSGWRVHLQEEKFPRRRDNILNP